MDEARVQSNNSSKAGGTPLPLPFPPPGEKQMQTTVKCVDELKPFQVKSASPPPREIDLAQRRGGFTDEVRVHPVKGASSDLYCFVYGLVWYVN